MSTSPSMHREFFWCLVGRELGRGSARAVWEFLPDPTLVVKIEENGQSFQNVMEWEIWKQVCETAHAHWFAPCRWISPNGSVMLQERTFPLEYADYPKKLPLYLTDHKYINYGMLNGRFVCHDYGTVLVTTSGLTSRLHNVTWEHRA